MRKARLTRQLLRCVALMPLLAVAACAGSQRFDGAARTPVAGGPVYNSPSPGPAPAISSGAVTSQPLPPPQGSLSPGVETPVASTQSGSGLPPPQDPFFSPTPPAAASQPQTLAGGGGRIATLGEGASIGRAGPVRSRDGVIGSWNAREATGGSCKVQLSSSPTLDLYRANASGCTNKDLQKVSAWDYRDGEVYLYQPGGSVVARLRPTDGSAMNGAVAKSGANLSLSR